MKSRISEAGRYFHLVLTVPTDTNDIASSIRRLAEAFSKLRRSAGWKRSIAGGFFKLETTYSRSADAFHPHIHAFIEGDGIDAERIGYRWLGLSEGRVESLKAIDSDDYRRNALSYVAKTPHAQLFDHPEQLTEYLAQTRKIRFYGTFGTFRGKDSPSGNERVKRGLDALPDPITNADSIPTDEQTAEITRSGDSLADRPTAQTVADIINARMIDRPLRTSGKGLAMRSAEVDTC